MCAVNVLAVSNCYSWSRGLMGRLTKAAKAEPELPTHGRRWVTARSLGQIATTKKLTQGSQVNVKQTMVHNDAELKCPG